MKIVSIKKVSNKYKLVLENGDVVTTYDEVILNTDILYKRVLDENLLGRILLENKYYDVYYKTLKYIKTKLRSEDEVSKYVASFDLSCDDQKKLIDKLKSSRAIDDEVFVKAYVHDKVSFSSDGPFKIRKDLLSHKISADIIDRELENIDEGIINDKLSSLVSKKISSNKKYSSSMLKQRLLSYFMNLGYDKNQIMMALSNNSVSDTDILKNEYLKLLNKLKNKYDGYELKRVLKQKLYQKGFSFEDINSIVD